MPDPNLLRNPDPDIEIIKRMLERAGIPYEAETIYGICEPGDEVGLQLVRMLQDGRPGVFGRSGSYTEIRFRPDGSLHSFAAKG